MGRLKHSPLRLVHSEELFAALSPEIFRYLRSRAPTSVRDERGYVRGLLAQVKASQSAYWVFREAEDGPVLGFGGIRKRENCAELSLWVARKYWGEGFGAEILEFMIDWCAQENTQPVIACLIDNKRARKLYSSRGFSPILDQTVIRRLFGKCEPDLIYFSRSGAVISDEA